jgi:hypothetical protein
LTKRPAHRNGWEAAKCIVYGKKATKLYNIFPRDPLADRLGDSRRDCREES